MSQCINAAGEVLRNGLSFDEALTNIYHIAFNYSICSLVNGILDFGYITSNHV